MLERISLDREKEYLEKCAKERKIPGGEFAIVTENESKCFCFGKKALLPNEVDNNIDTMYDLASLTKVVSTTTMVLQCIEEGYFSLQTDIRNLIDVPYKGVTIENLLTHTSGLCADDKNYRKCSNKQEMIDFVLNKELSYPTNSKVEYSDFGFILLGIILEKYVGDLDKYAQDNIFDPLEMKDTCYNPKSCRKYDRCAPTELTSDRGLVCGEVHDGKGLRLNGVSGNAGLFSTVDDLTHFVQMLLLNGSWKGRRILHSSTVELLKHCRTEGLNDRRTLGWFTNDRTTSMGDYYSEHCLYHTGFTGTSIYVDFDRKCGIILLTNRVHPTRDNNYIFDIRSIVHNMALLDFDDAK